MKKSNPWMWDPSSGKLAHTEGMWWVKNPIGILIPGVKSCHVYLNSISLNHAVELSTGGIILVSPSTLPRTPDSV